VTATVHDCVAIRIVRDVIILIVRIVVDGNAHGS